MLANNGRAICGRKPAVTPLAGCFRRANCFLKPRCCDPFRRGARPSGFSVPSENGVLSDFHEGDSVAIDFLIRPTDQLGRNVWATDGDRLVRRFLPDADPQLLFAEPVLDHPEIELRFIADENGEPVLAEVAFPADMTASVAKRFLFEHLEDVRLQPTGESRTDETPDAVVIGWPAADRLEELAEWVTLHPGVREKVVGNGPDALTAAVEFDRTAGWDAAKAVAWLANHLPAGSPSRAA